MAQRECRHRLRDRSVAPPSDGSRFERDHRISPSRRRRESIRGRGTASGRMAYGDSMYQANCRPHSACVIIERW